MKITIVGCGKMGSWIAKELAKENEVSVYDVNKSKIGSIGNVKNLNDLEEIKQFEPEVLINAVTLQNTIKAFDEIVKYLPENCILADVTSIKSGLPDYYKKCSFKFVSVHPMFGPTFATMESLREENAIIIKEGDEQGKSLFQKLFSSLNIRIFDYSFKEHDEMMAYSLTTPFVSSMVFAACMDSTAVPGSTFARHRKIARGVLSEDDHLLAEILFNPNSLKQLEKITARLEFLKHVIKAKDYEETNGFFDKLRKNIG
ncbi:MAG: prephenate dehydrogenase/arogenate dehydrogenase family protein [Candidatus Micrarchaeota archaeon]|nr:prephenate dehydrogenase/arogenate dehydrogenase family protein [Candidatus Micrarchaeota archaeon]